MTDVKATLATKCFEQLTESILKGDLLPGTKLLCEELKKQLGVGMSPVREALSKLAASHFVTFEEHKGFHVAKIEEKELVPDILTFAEIECLCLKQSLSQGKDEWEGNVIATLHALKKIEKGEEIDYFTWAPANARFHYALISACPLKPLMNIRAELYQKHQWYVLLSYKFSDKPLLQANHEEHKKIAELALERKGHAAADALYHHIASSREEILNKLKSKGLVHNLPK